MKRILLASLALLAAPACIIADTDSELTVVNDSSYDFMELRLAPVDSGVWGPNELGIDPLFAGESVTLGGIECDSYDLLIVDDTERECVLTDFSLCLGDRDVTHVNNTDLRFCPFAR